jgi:hypothetical protein
MNEYANASKPDHPLTSPVAFLRNKVGADVDSDAMLASNSLRTGFQQMTVVSR